MNTRSILIAGILLIAGSMSVKTYAVEPTPGGGLTGVAQKAMEQQPKSEADRYRKLLEYYERPGNGNYATVKGGRLNHLRFLVRKYQVTAQQDLSAAGASR